MTDEQIAWMREKIAKNGGRIYDQLEAAAIDGIVRGDLREAAPFLRAHGSDALALLGMLAEQGRLCISMSRKERTALRELEIGGAVALAELKSTMNCGRRNSESAVSAAKNDFKNSRQEPISEATVRRASRTWKKLTRPFKNN